MKLLAILCVISLITTSTVFADQCTKASGQTNPCEGVLLPTEWARQCQVCTDVDLPSCKLELSRTKSLWAIDKTMFAVELAAEHTYTTRLETLVKTMSAPVVVRPAWYESGMFVFTTGIFVGGAMVGITAKLLK